MSQHCHRCSASIQGPYNLCSKCYINYSFSPQQSIPVMTPLPTELSDIPVAIPVNDSISLDSLAQTQYAATNVDAIVTDATCHIPNNNQSKSKQMQDGTKFGNYIGSFNDQGHRNGYGTMHYNDGSVYDGYWNNNKKEGHGKMYYSSGPQLDGTWKNNKLNGSATYYYPEGQVDLRRYKWDECVGEGVQYSSDRQRFYLLNGGRIKKEIDNITATKIAMRLGLSEPRE